MGREDCLAGPAVRVKVAWGERLENWLHHKDHGTGVCMCVCVAKQKCVIWGCNHYQSADTVC